MSLNKFVDDSIRRSIPLEAEDYTHGYDLPKGAKNIKIHYKGGAEVDIPADIDSLTFELPEPEPEYNTVNVPMAGRINTISHGMEWTGNPIPVIFHGVMNLPANAVKITLIDGEITYQVPI
jgi:hypothetical protein